MFTTTQKNKLKKNLFSSFLYNAKSIQRHPLKQLNKHAKKIKFLFYYCHNRYCLYMIIVLIKKYIFNNTLFFLEYVFSLLFHFCTVEHKILKQEIPWQHQHPFYVLILLSPSCSFTCCALGISCFLIFLHYYY